MQSFRLRKQKIEEMLNLQHLCDKGRQHLGHEHDDFLRIRDFCQNMCFGN